ncbi:hypothetical protein BC829DRAFT_404173 [Chytridium lagenaria]|nr:hypothetical protein BC829DRAFT_404173 [Chytridium lagenaria]
MDSQTSSMRILFLTWWLETTTIKRPTSFKMVDGTTVTGTLTHMDGDGTLFNVSDLVTPLGVYEDASLRVRDCKYFLVDV